MSHRPRDLHPSRSFNRLDAAPKRPSSRSRASTLQGPAVPHIPDEQADSTVSVAAAVPDAFEELPIEIRSLTERFLDSLTAKVHPTPLSADALVDLFQDFYTRASAKITTHIATLSARLTSEAYVAHANKATTLPLLRKGKELAGEQQMLSAAEIAVRKQARKALEAKRLALEEAVERAVCERVYHRIWRHRSTDDQERDHKLRSRTAALSLVGIGLKELLMTGDAMTKEERQKTKDKEPEIREWLSTARHDLLRMNDEKYPLGKIHHLTAAHKSIVEALSKIFPSTSSADEILPTLIYALITLPPVHLNVISDLRFIQRFRGSTRMDGETAYCLVNLEAAISFLETVDLSSLRAEESEPYKSDSRPSTPKTAITPMPLGLSDAPDLMQTPATPTSTSFHTESSSPTATKAQRRLSNLIQTQTNKFEAASDVVRDSILDSADQALGRINTTLDSSFKFFFGNIKDKDPNSPVLETPILPKTLEDARKLMSSPSRANDDDDSRSVSAASSVHGDEVPELRTHRTLETKMTDLLAGRRQIRDRSVDSTRSGDSSNGRRAMFTSAPGAEEKTLSSAAAVKMEPISSTNSSAVDSLRSMGNSLNPLNRFAGMSVLPRFGRAVSNTSTPVLPSPNTDSGKSSPLPEPLGGMAITEGAQSDVKGARAVAALDQLKKTPPPVKRFVEAKDAQELKLKEIDELLKEYQRLAGALRSAINY